MNRAAGRVGDGFVKHYPSAEVAREAIWRSHAAACAGVLTPAVIGLVGRDAVQFQRIDAEGRADLAEMLTCLDGLHGMERKGLQRFDPFLRVRPRLGEASAHIRALAKDLALEDAGLGWEASQVIHGDFHPGQVLRDGHGRIWLIDLDDLALAPAEADLGNLAAWQATQAQGRLAPALAGAIDQILSRRPGANPTLVAHFGRIAVLRRALKLAHRGQPWALAQLDRPRP